MNMDEAANSRGRAGHQDALFYELMNEHATELKRIAFLYINDLGECEDIIQEVFINCYHHLDDFRYEANLKTWLIRMTINKCKDHHRLWRVKTLVYKPVLRLTKKSPSAEDQYLESQTSSDIISHISSLSPKYKEVLILYYYQEMTMQEISEILSISINTVKSRLLRGKRTLQTHLERVIDHGQV